MIDQKDIMASYESLTQKNVILTISLLLLLTILILLSLALGAMPTSLADVMSALGRTGERSLQVIIWNIRLPRILTAVLAGGGLAVAGTIMQSILRNPLGSPFTLGISQAAGFGAAFAIVFLGTFSVQGGSSASFLLNSGYLTTLSAFIWALISTSAILILVKYKSPSPETMILTGVALGSLFTAATAALQYLADDVQLAAIVFWTFGDVGRTTWSNLGLIALVMVPCLIYYILNSWNYSVMSAGDETARGLGVPVHRIRVLGMLSASFLTAVIISFVGIIGFVGLVAPHIGRKLIGPNERYLIPFSTIIGSTLLLASDTAARTLAAPIVIPVGILTAFLGAPLFIYLVIKGREYMWS